MKRMLVILLTLMLLACTACAPAATGAPEPAAAPAAPASDPGAEAPAAAPAAEEKVLRIGKDMSQALHLNTLQTTYDQINEASNAVCEQMITCNPETLELQPTLLTQMPTASADGLTYTFQLKQGVKFHDGTELTSKDVKYTLERFFAPASANINLEYGAMIKGGQDIIDGKATELSGFNAIDDYNFTITLDYPTGAFVSFLATSPYGIVPADACAAAGDQWATSVLIGTGPFMLDSFVAGEKIVLVKNPDYHGTPAGIDRIELSNMEDSTALLEWEAGNLDMCILDTTIVGDYLNSEYADNVKCFPIAGTYMLQFRACDKPFDDIRVRQAVGYATDVDSIVNDYFGGYVTRANTWIPEGVIGFDPNAPVLEYNPEKAKALLAEAGYPDGVQFTALVRETSSKRGVLEVLQEQYRQVGITMDIELTDAAGWTESLHNGKVAFYINDWFAEYMHPDNFMAVYHSDNFDSESTGFSDPYYDEQVEAGLKITDIAQMQKFYQDLDNYLVHTVVEGWPLYNEARYMLCSDRVEGVVTMPDLSMNFTMGKITD